MRRRASREGWHCISCEDERCEELVGQAVLILGTVNTNRDSYQKYEHHGNEIDRNCYRKTLLDLVDDGPSIRGKGCAKIKLYDALKPHPVF